MNRSNFAQLQHPQIDPGILKSRRKFTSYERVTIHLFLEIVPRLEKKGLCVAIGFVWIKLLHFSILK